MPAPDPHPLRSRSWIGYLVAVFLNAFNDNAFKVLVGLALLRTLPPDAAHGQGGILLAAVSALFIIPFLLFSSWAGSLADRYSKRTVFVVMSGYEIFAMLLAAAGFATMTTEPGTAIGVAADAGHAVSGVLASGNAWSPGSLSLIAAALFWTGAQSAFYSPAKYGLIPELLPESEISRANGQVEAATFAAIVLGTAFGGFILPWTGGRPEIASLACVGVAVLGVAASRLVAPVAPADPGARTAWLNPFGETFRVLRDALGERPLAAAMGGLAFFWFLGAIIQMAALLLARHALFAGQPDAVIESRTGLLLAVLSLGIGIGSLVAGRLSHERIEPGLVIPGALGTAAFLASIAFLESPVAAALAFGALGFAAGFFAVPLQSAVQGYAPPRRRGAFLGASNFVVFTAILASSAVLPALQRVTSDAHGVFLALSLLTVLAALGLALWDPQFRARFILLTRRDPTRRDPTRRDPTRRDRDH